MNLTEAQIEARGVLEALGEWRRVHAATCPLHQDDHVWATCYCSYCKVQADARTDADAALMAATKDIPF